MKTRSLGWNRAFIEPGAGLLLYILLIQLAGCSHTPSARLAWDPNQESYLAGYNVYRSEQSGVFTSLPINGTALVTRTDRRAASCWRAAPTPTLAERVRPRGR